MLITSLALAIASPAGAVPPYAKTYIADVLRLKRYSAAQIDLNKDGAAEILAYAQDQSRCGSGGCTLFVLTPTADSYRVVSTVTLVRLPVRALATQSNGWSDLGVSVSGGGIRRAYEARLRFDGSSYPSNPTMPPASPVRNALGQEILWPIK